MFVGLWSKFWVVDVHVRWPDNWGLIWFDVKQTLPWLLGLWNLTNDLQTSIATPSERSWFFFLVGSFATIENSGQDMVLYHSDLSASTTWVMLQSVAVIQALYSDGGNQIGNCFISEHDLRRNTSNQLAFLDFQFHAPYIHNQDENQEWAQSQCGEHQRNGWTIDWESLPSMLPLKSLIKPSNDQVLQLERGQMGWDCGGEPKLTVAGLKRLFMEHGRLASWFLRSFGISMFAYKSDLKLQHPFILCQRSRSSVAPNVLEPSARPSAQARVDPKWVDPKKPRSWGNGAWCLWPMSIWGKKKLAQKWRNSSLPFSIPAFEVTWNFFKLKGSRNMSRCWVRQGLQGWLLWQGMQRNVRCERLGLAPCDQVIAALKDNGLIFRPPLDIFGIGIQKNDAVPFTCLSFFCNHGMLIGCI